MIIVDIKYFNSIDIAFEIPALHGGGEECNGSYQVHSKYIGAPIAKSVSLGPFVVMLYTRPPLGAAGRKPPISVTHVMGIV